MKNLKAVLALTLACVLLFSIGVAMGGGRNINVTVKMNTTGQNQPVTQTQAPVETTAPTTQAPMTTEPVQTTSPVAENPTEATTAQAPETTARATQAPETTISTTQAPASSGPKIDMNKKGDLVKSKCDSKIWAKILGECYIVIRNIDDGNEWGEKGKVYELHVTYVKTGEEYSMWSDGYWEMNSDCTELTLKPLNQSENGNIGCAAGESKTYKAENGVFEIPITFEQGGKTTIYMDLAKDAL